MTLLWAAKQLELTVIVVSVDSMIVLSVFVALEFLTALMTPLVNWVSCNKHLIVCAILVSNPILA
jgi:hypothetical protein